MTLKEWRAEASKQMVLRDMTKKDLAEELGLTYHYIVAVMCGQVRTKRTIKRISDTLGIQPYDE